MSSRIADVRVVLALSVLVVAGACQEDLDDEGSVTPHPPPPTFNQPPVLGHPTFTVPPNRPAALDLLAGASDPDGDALTVTQAFPDPTGPRSASIALRADHRTVDVTPLFNFVGTVFLGYFVDDGHGHSVQGQASVLFDSAPVADFSDQKVDKDTATEVSLQAFDADSDPLTYTIATQPRHGTLSGPPPDLIYTPVTEFLGDDSFTFTVSDGHLTSFAGTVSLHVVTPDHRPSATPQSVMALAQAGGDSFDARISDDGNRIAFTSKAFDLVTGDANGASDIFVRDITAGTTTRVSVSAIGADTDLASTEPAISGDGRFVAFTSAATNLVAGDSNGVTDIFVRDLTAGTTSRVSVSSTGGQADKASTGASLSRDGQFVSFLSSATTLVANASGTQVYVRDTQALTTTRPLTFTSMISARLSADGRYLAGYDFTTGVTICDRFKPATATLPGSGLWAWPILSGNGRYVAVLNTAVPGVTLVVAPNPL